MATQTKEVALSYIERWRPDFRYRSDKKIVPVFSDPIGGFISKDDTKTDTEAYKLTLASLRGDIQSAQGSGQLAPGLYSIPAGQEYDPDSDFSYLRRPDITLVELDEYITDFKQRLETADSRLAKRIEAELAAVEARKQELHDIASSSDSSKEN